MFLANVFSHLALHIYLCAKEQKPKKRLNIHSNKHSHIHPSSLIMASTSTQYETYTRLHPKLNISTSEYQKLEL